VVDDTRFSLSSFSRYCDDFVKTGSSTDDPKGFLETLERVIDERGIDLVIPMDDQELDLLQLEPNRIGSLCAIAAPERDSYDIARDKLLTTRLAKSLNIEIPKSCLVRDGESVESILSVTGLPAILKPRKGSGSRGLLFMKSERDMEVAMSSIDKRGEMLAQEFIPSAGGIGVSLLVKDGLVRASFTHKRIMEFPEAGGPSLVRVSTHNSIAESAAERLLRNLRWNGVAMVEFRLDSRTGKPVLMEINPRFWGSLPLAIACGIDFPKLLCDMYEFGDVAPSRTYQAGVGCVNLLPFGVSSVLARNGMRRLARVLGYGFEFKHFDVESFDDPLPAFGALLHMLSSTLDSANIEIFFRR
jgi:predicted ATP-grasp superfamily ATP-dependent carboligase